VLEVGLGGFIRHIDAGAVHSELPAVVHAAKAGFLVPSKEQRGATMWAVVLDQADLAVAVAEGDELLAQQLHPHRIAVG
jgi:hypothetical protein